MRIVVVGSGYVGLVSGAGFADFGNEVLCVDVDHSKIDALERRLRFGTSLEEATRWGEVVFICVGTPQLPSGKADLTAVFGATRTIARAMPSYRLIVQKSTVPVGTGDRVQAILKKYVKRGVGFDVASNPEFLREGQAVENFLRPDRIVIGANAPRARDLLHNIYAPLYLIETPTVVTSLRTAELRSEEHTSE